MADNLAHHYNQLGRGLNIDDLPDDILLEIFNLCVVRYQDLGFPGFRSFRASNTKRKIESWQSLVHVCRRWRCLVFGSPRHLNLQICCYTQRLFSRMTMNVWPALPIVIEGNVWEALDDDVIAGLKHWHSDRICGISLDCYSTTFQTEKLWTAMQVPFPELAFLRMEYPKFPWPVLPDSFLGGYAPRLRCFALSHIPFPGLPKLLSSATHLVELCLSNIPHSGYISPDAMVTCLSMLTSLKTLHLSFKSPYPDFKSRRPFPPTRSVLPTLMYFLFKGPGMSKYLEEFVARIDAPRLTSTTFFDDISFDTPELNQFISRTATLGAYDETRLIFTSHEALVKLRQSHPERSDHRMIEVLICQPSDRQLLTLARICTLSLSLILTIEDLYIDGDVYSPLVWTDDIESTKWLDVLLPFRTVKNLYLSKLFSPRIARALQELTGGRITEVLPALQNILLEEFQSSEPVQEGIAQFISARQLTNRPVTISVWDRNRDLVGEEVDD